jgi:large conductance mechanosensitive channel
VVGAAFGSVVTAFTKDLLTPLIAAVVAKPDFSAIQFTVNNSKFLLGDFVNTVVSFVIVATAVYYFVVLPINALVSRARKEPPADPTTKKCPECLSEIAIGAKRCAFCTSQVG